MSFVLMQMVCLCAWIVCACSSLQTSFLGIFRYLYLSEDLLLRLFVPHKRTQESLMLRSQLHARMFNAGQKFTCTLKDNDLDGFDVCQSALHLPHIELKLYLEGSSEEQNCHPLNDLRNSLTTT